jgi:hypothetical protein
VAAVERAVSAAGHVIVDMTDFPAAGQAPAQVCADRVRGCEVYVGVLGTRYGSPVRDKPQVSYTELEFDTATEAGLDRLVFLLDTDVDVGIPPVALIDREFGSRQDAFRRRVQSELTTQSFASPAELGQLVERSLRGLADTRGRIGSLELRPGRVWNIPVPVRIFTGRDTELDDLSRRLTATAASDAVPTAALYGLGGIGKTQLARAFAHRHRDRYQVGWWIPAETPLVAAAALAALAVKLGGDHASPQPELVREALDALAGRDDWLLIFDNASSPAGLEPLLPTAGGGQVLITTRSPAWQGLATPGPHRSAFAGGRHQPAPEAHRQP